MCCLAFLFPLVVAYEMGALMLRPEVWPEQQLLAQSFIQQLVAWFGADAVWIPGAALLVTLVLWQLLSKETWRLRIWVPLLMVFESVALTVPLFVLGRLLQQSTGLDPITGLKLKMILALGAGVYEELVFRFFLINLLLGLLTAVCKMPERYSTAAAVVLAAAVFAACHLSPIGAGQFTWPMFLMLTTAGAYLSTIYVLRGLGVSTGCHAAFNLLTIWLAGQ